MYKIITTYHPSHRPWLWWISNAINGDWRLKTWLVAESDKHYGVVEKNSLIQSCDDDDVIVFMDADDFPAWDLFDVLDCYFSEDNHDVVYGDCLFLTKSGSGFSATNGISRPFDVNDLIEKNFIFHSGTAVRGRIAKLGRWLSLPAGRDWVYWVQLARHTDKFYYTGQTHSYIRTYTSTRNFRRWNVPGVRKLIRMNNDRLARKAIKGIVR